MGGNITTFPNATERAILDNVTDAFRVYEVTVSAATVTVGILGNTMTLVALLSDKELRHRRNVFVANLAFVDLLVSAIHYPATIYTERGDDDAGHCRVLGAIMTCLTLLSVDTMSVIAFTRYVLICCSSSTAASMFKLRNLVLAVGSLWLVGVAMISPPVLGFGKFSYNEKTRSCLVLSYDYESYVYGLGLASACNVLPAVAIGLFAYVNIALHVRRSRRILTTTGLTVTSGPRPVISSANGTESSSRGPEAARGLIPKVTIRSYPGRLNFHSLSMNRRERKDVIVTLHLVVIFVVFLICYIPAATLFAYDYSGRVPSAVYAVLMKFALSHASLNVFVNAYMSPSYRLAYKNILFCRWKDAARLRRN